MPARKRLFLGRGFLVERGLRHGWLRLTLLLRGHRRRCLSLLHLRAVLLRLRRIYHGRPLLLAR